MARKLIAIIIFFYLLALVQTSFLPHFFKWFPNLILIAVALISFQGDRKESSSLVSGLAGGFFLDIFSDKCIGYYIIMALMTTLFVKLIVKRILR